MCLGLSKRGYKVYLVISDNLDSEIIKGVNIISIPKIGGRFLRATLISLKIIIKSLRLNGDIYHFHDPELLLWSPILLLFGKKTIYDAHEDLVNQIDTKDYLAKYEIHYKEISNNLP